MPDWGPESLVTPNRQEWTVNFKKKNQESLLSVENGLGRERPSRVWQGNAYPKWPDLPTAASLAQPEQADQPPPHKASSRQVLVPCRPPSHPTNAG